MKGVIAGDSLLRPVSNALPDPNLKTVFCPGATVSSLTEELFSANTFSDNLWRDVKFVWLLVGTNDVDNGMYRDEYFDLKHFLKLYSNLLLTIKAHVRDINIVVSGLVPRLTDYQMSKGLINLVNKKLRNMCADFGVKFCAVDKAFCIKGIPQEAYFKPDRLHLSTRGATVLVKVIQREFHVCNKSF